MASWEHALLGVPTGGALEESDPPRADIVDRDGEVLAAARPVWHVGIDKTQVEALLRTFAGGRRGRGERGAPEATVKV